MERNRIQQLLASAMFQNQMTAWLTGFRGKEVFQIARPVSPDLNELRGLGCNVNEWELHFPLPKKKKMTCILEVNHHPEGNDHPQTIMGVDRDSHATLEQLLALALHLSHNNIRDFGVIVGLGTKERRGDMRYFPCIQSSEPMRLGYVCYDSQGHDKWPWDLRFARAKVTAG